MANRRRRSRRSEPAPLEIAWHTTPTPSEAYLRLWARVFAEIGAVGDGTPTRPPLTPRPASAVDNELE